MTHYELWSFESGNRMAYEQTLEAIVEMIRGIRDANPGYHYWEHWGVGADDDEQQTWQGDELKALVEA